MTTRPLRLSALVILAGLIMVAGPAFPDGAKTTPPGMSLTRMNDLIEAVGDDVEQLNSGQWRFKVEKISVLVIADPPSGRMRILAGIAKVENVPPALLRRLMQANFDTTLDARYAIAKGLLWSMFLHPLKSLTDPLFLSGLGQTVNLNLTFGKTFSSGALTFQGGDSPGLIERQLIDRLLEQGRAI